jgi:hypothetical protein
MSRTVSGTLLRDLNPWHFSQIYSLVRLIHNFYMFSDVQMPTPPASALKAEIEDRLAHVHT